MSEPLESFGQVIAGERRRRLQSLKQVASQILKPDGQPISAQYLDNLEKDLRRPAPGLVGQFSRLFDISEDLLFATLGILPPHLLSAVQSRQQLLLAFEAFEKSLASTSTDRKGPAVVIHLVQQSATPPVETPIDMPPSQTRRRTRQPIKNITS